MKDWLFQVIQGFCISDFNSYCPVLANYIATSLTPEIRSRILTQLIPYPLDDKDVKASEGELSNSWKFNCLAAKDRIKCKVHPECVLCYSQCEQILKLLFKGDMPALLVDLRRIDSTDLRPVIRRVAKTIHESPFVHLKVLKLSGGTAHVDAYLKSVEKCCYVIRKKAHCIDTLHLPIGSNELLLECSKMPKLRQLCVDRTKHMDNKGLKHLSSRSSYTRENLRLLHIGVFKHRGFKKADVARFLIKMQNLVQFSLRDEERALIENFPQSFLSDSAGNGGGPVGRKVMTYSAVKLGIVDSSFRLKQDFKSQLKEIKVIDRELSPDYLLQACPNLTRLYIDWQQELSDAPFSQFSPDWFPNLLKNPDWKQLLASLTHLSITFPSSSQFVFTWENLSNFVSGIGGLHSLALTGCDNLNEPMPLIWLLKKGHCLKELILDKCNVYLPHAVEEDGFRHHTLKKFHLTGDKHSLSYHPFITHSIAHFMPNLKELVISPQSSTNTTGLEILQIRELTSMERLERLNVPLSLDDCMSNMPQVVYVLREFPALRYLVASWGSSADFNPSRILRLQYWLENALQAENANIHLQLNFELHHGIYTNPPSSFYA